MADPVRVQIMKKAAEKLAAISVSAGYRHDVVQVLRTSAFPSEINEFPVLLLRPSNEESRKVYEEMEAGGDLDVGETGGTIDGWMGIDVFALAEGSDAKLTSDLLEELLADAEIALTDDLHLGLSPDVVHDIRDLGTWESYPVNSERGYREMASTTYLVHYSYLRGAP